MPNTSETTVQNASVPGDQIRNLERNPSDQLKEFTRLCNGDDGPADQVFDDFVRNFDAKEMLGPFLRDLPEEKKEKILGAAARCHVASLGRGREFLENRKQLHLVDEGSSVMFGALPATLRAAMITRAYVGDRGQVVLPFPDIELSIPVGRTLLGTGDGALTTHEIRELLMHRQGRAHSLLEIFSAKLAHFGAWDVDVETCHVWNDLIDRLIDGEPIVKFSEERAVLDALAFALKDLADRALAWGGGATFPIRRMLVDSAKAYFLAGEYPSSGASLVELGFFQSRKGEFEESASTFGAAASMLARKALEFSREGQSDKADTLRRLALHAYSGVIVVPVTPGSSMATVSGESDDRESLAMFGEYISLSAFEALWADPSSGIEEIRSRIESAQDVLSVVRRIGALLAKPSGSGTSD